MKRTKAVLAVTTCLLAMAGLAAAKAHRSPITKVFYNAANGCVLFTGRSCVIDGFGVPCKTIIGTGIYTLYTQQASPLCKHIARYNDQ